jgi:hypothetical protein
MEKPDEKLPEYLVLRDTREQYGWGFPAKGQCLGTVEATLKTGDYTLQGYEDIFVVERKYSTSEISQNIVQDRFKRELERLEEFRYPFMVFEFTLAEVISFPINSGIPKDRWKSLRITPQFMLKRLNEYQFKYKTKIVFAGIHGREFTSSLFKRMVENGRPD